MRVRDLGLLTDGSSDSTVDKAQNRDGTQGDTNDGTDRIVSNSIGIGVNKRNWDEKELTRSYRGQGWQPL